MEPMRMKPYYRSGEATPWGGCKLRELFMKDAPDTAGESLEVSALSGMESVILNGEYSGRKLSEALSERYEDIVGEPGAAFPLLLKLLDARDNLSVQVHPGDAYAREHEGMPGKTEAWVILSADEGAQIAYGVRDTGVGLGEIMARGDIKSALNFIQVKPGDVYYIPHGMIHALGGGVMAYEIQQSSSATYRIWDWDRLDKYGNARELHAKKALDAARPELAYSKLPGATALCEGGSKTYYVCDENFELARLNVSGRMPLAEGRMAFITPLGECEIGFKGGGMRLGFMETALIPARASVFIKGKLPVLYSALPDRQSALKQLTHRARDVAGLCE